MRHSLLLLALTSFSLMSVGEASFIASLLLPETTAVSERSSEGKAPKSQEPRAASFLYPFDQEETSGEAVSDACMKEKKKNSSRRGNKKSAPPAPKMCNYSIRSEQIQLSHIEGKGVGYDQGYTTLQALFAADAIDFYPMLDLRGHVFNDGKFAANVGAALRYVGCRVYGVNAFYDYRQTPHSHYNQLSLGFDTLGKWVDFRINGYLPIGRKESNSFHHKKELALAGVNAEIGVHMFEIEQVKLYAAAGPYYFGSKGKNAWGGEARASALFYDHLSIQLSSSYDSLFRWIGQAQIGLIYFFGPLVKTTVRGDRSCCEEAILRKRATQWIDRSEIIVLDRKHSSH